MIQLIILFVNFETIKLNLKVYNIYYIICLPYIVDKFA